MAGILYDASTTDASNSAFAGVNLGESVMNPSDVNDFIRAHLGAQKRFLLDLGGTGTVAGSATAITLTANQAFDAYGTSTADIPNGAICAFKAGSASAAGGTTLNVNSIGTKKVLTQSGAAIAAGDWVSGAFVLLRYDSAADTGTGAWILLNRAAGRVNGTATNDDAVAGYVGEFLETVVASGSAVALSNNTAANVTSKSFTAGDWDIWGDIVILTSPGTTTSAQRGGISQTSATFDTLPAGGQVINLHAQGNNTTVAFGVGPVRVSLASTTTVYLVALATIAGGAGVTAYGGIHGRRVR